MRKQRVWSKHAHNKLPLIQRMLEMVAFGREVVEVDWNERLDDNNTMMFTPRQGELNL